MINFRNTVTGTVISLRVGSLWSQHRELTSRVIRVRSIINLEKDSVGDRMDRGGQEANFTAAFSLCG